MIPTKETMLSGLALNAERPMHKLLEMYLSLIDCTVSTKDGEVIVTGELPGKRRLFAGLVSLSKQLNEGDVVFDLEMQRTKSGIRSFEVIDKNPNAAKKINDIPFENFDKEIIDLLFIEYLLANNSVVYLDKNKEICYLAGDEPLDQNDFILEATKFIANEIKDMRIQQGEPLTSENEDEFMANSSIYDADPRFLSLFVIKYLLINDGQVGHDQNGIFMIGGNLPKDSETYNNEISKFIITEYSKLQNKGMIIVPEVEEELDPGFSYTQGIYTAFSNVSNWLFGSSDEKSQAKNTQAPNPRR